MARKTVLCALAVVLATPAHAQRGYLTPVRSEGRVFPIARSEWFAVINFADDWHAPRMRFEAGRWVQAGVHEGNDIFTEPGTPIVSVTSGTVEQIGWTFYSGWRVGVRGDDGNYWFYAHMRRYAPDLGIGVRVDPGTVLGEVGNTGYGATAGHDDEFTWHLHLGIQEPDGTWVNPYPLLKRLYGTDT